MSTITATFNRYTNDQDTTETYLRDHSGERVTVLGPLDLDHDEFTMSRIRFADGHTSEAFDDELTEWRLEK